MDMVFIRARRTAMISVMVLVLWNMHGYQVGMTEQQGWVSMHVVMKYEIDVIAFLENENTF